METDNNTIIDNNNNTTIDNNSNNSDNKENNDNTILNENNKRIHENIKYGILNSDDANQPSKKVILNYDKQGGNIVTVEDPNDPAKNFVINKKYIQADGSILSKEQYKKNIKASNKQKKKENSQAYSKKKKQEKQKKNDEEGNITKAILDETTYYYKDNLRHITPYQYTFKVFAKERWFGQSLLDMFSYEFSTNSRENYLKKIKRGLIKVNDAVVSPSYKIKLGDTIVHTVHRHEPPVCDQRVKIVAIDDEVVVVDKPSSMPVHPCGRFRHNTLMYILASEHGINQLYGVHRLDRLTSGLLMLARTPESATKKATQIQSNSVSKQYIAKVIGKFPATSQDGKSDTIIVDQPIVIQSMRLGINHVGPGGKESTTHFKLYSYDEQSNTSIVLCTPKTGRTHQIRVHLKWFGYPIANDPLYNNEFKESFKALTSDGTSSYLFDDEETGGDGNSNSNNNNGEAPSNKVSKVTKEEELFIDDGESPIECKDCSIVWSDSSKFSFGIYLHALSYSSDGWSYKTDLPPWAISSSATNNDVETNNTTTTTTTTTTTNTNTNTNTENKE